jgi:hypothetical protein
VFRRSLLLLPAVLAAVSLPVSPALAGEDNDVSLDVPRNCVSDNRVKATVSGDDIDSVAFYVDGERVRRVTRPTNRGTFVFTMRCSALSVGAHRARAVVNFESGSSPEQNGSRPEQQTLRFQITRAARRSPRFTG